MDMKNNITIIERIRINKNKLSKKHQIIANYYIENYKKAAFLNSSNLARILNVSEATLYRFAIFLGYKGYPQMQSAIQEIIQAELTSEDRLKIAMEKNLLKKGKHVETFERVFLSELETMNKFFRSIDKNLFVTTSQMMSKAKKIFIVGILGTASLAQYFTYNLGKIHPDVTCIQHGSGEDLFKLRFINSKTLIFIITFPRYNSLIVEMAKRAKKQHAKLIGITNNVLSPIAPYCDIGFYIDTVKITSFMGACATPTCLIHAIITEYSQKNIQKSKRQLKIWEEIVKKENLFLQR